MSQQQVQVRWCYQNDGGAFQPYDKEISDLIEKGTDPVVLPIFNKRFCVQKDKRLQVKTSNASDFPRRVVRGSWFYYEVPRGSLSPQPFAFTEKQAAILEQAYQNHKKNNDFDKNTIIDLGDNKTFVVMHSEDLILSYKYFSFGKKLTSFPVRTIDLNSNDDSQYQQPLHLGYIVSRGFKETVKTKMGEYHWFIHIQKALDPDQKMFLPYYWVPLSMKSTLLLEDSREVRKNSQQKITFEKPESAANATFKNCVADFSKNEFSCDYEINVISPDYDNFGRPIGRAKTFKGNSTFPLCRANWFFVEEALKPYPEKVCKKLDQALEKKEFNKEIEIDDNKERYVILESQDKFRQYRFDDKQKQRPRLVIRSYLKPNLAFFQKVIPLKNS